MSAAAARKGYVQPCVTETQLPKSISGVVASDPTKSRFDEPFAAARPTSITEADWSALQNRARAIISTQINPAYQNLGTVFARDVLPRCSEAIGASALPQGRDYYAWLVTFIPPRTGRPTTFTSSA